MKWLTEKGFIINPNNTGKSALHSMKKDELLDFAWDLIESYNMAINLGNELQNQVEYLENLLIKTREQAGIIRTGEGEQF